MTAVVLARPPLVAAPPPPIVQWHGFRHEWTGPTGVVVDLLSNGLCLLNSDVVGLHLPQHDDHVSTAVRVSGQQYRGGRYEPRAVEWPLLVWSDDSTAAFLARDSAFWRSLSFDKPGTWTVTSPNGVSRSLRCRLVNTTDYGFATDPALHGWALYTVDLVADDPFWYGQTVSTGWANVTGHGMFTGGWITVTSNATTEGATVTNPGDVPAWLSWTVRGPISSGTLTVGDGSLGLPAVADGSVLTVDTDPASGRVRLDGVKAMSSMTAWDPRPVPVGGSIPVGIDITGSGKWSVDVSFRPRFWRAW